MRQRVRIRMTMTHTNTDYPIDYTAQNAREFNALRGIELIDANVNKNGELVAVFDVSATQPKGIELALRSFVDALLPSGEEPENIKFEELSGDIVPIPDSNIVPMPGVTEE
jgi:hypothetical protein